MIPWIQTHVGDGLEWMRSLPDDSVDLWITSPPYENARSYGGMRIPRGEKWVEWYIPFVVEMCRTSAGFAAVNVAGLVNNFSYSSVDCLLVADLRRKHGIVLGPSPYAWVKSSGIPGSGSKHYHRRNHEPVYLFAHPDKLPPAWSDNTAFGAPCKFKPGGEFSYSTRVRTGGRVKKIETRPTERNGQEYAKRAYNPPAVANPGNVITTLNGGGHTGSRLTKENEAPMNLAVAERFVCWFARRGAVVGDPMAGSGTTGHAALMHGRRTALCDSRPGQIELCRRRLAAVVEVKRPG